MTSNATYFKKILRNTFLLPKPISLVAIYYCYVQAKTLDEFLIGVLNESNANTVSQTEEGEGMRQGVYFLFFCTQFDCDIY